MEGRSADAENHSKYHRGISVPKKGIIRIFRSTIKELGDPRYIRFLFNPEKRTLEVQSVSRKEAECFRVPKYNPKN